MILRVRENDGDKAEQSQGFHSLPITQPWREFLSPFISFNIRNNDFIFPPFDVGWVGSSMGIDMGLSQLLVRVLGGNLAGAAGVLDFIIFPSLLCVCISISSKYKRILYIYTSNYSRSKLCTSHIRIKPIKGECVVTRWRVKSSPLPKDLF